MIHTINLHHRIFTVGGGVARVTQDQPSSELTIEQEIWLVPQFSVYSYFVNFKPTFGLPPESYISGGCAYVKDDTGPETLVGTDQKYICIDGYDGSALTHQRPRAKNLVALMYWLDQLNDWHEWGLDPLFKFYQVSDQTSTLHTFIIDDTILDGENWTHVDIVQQIRNRIHEIANIMGFTHGSKFYLGQVGYSYFLPTSDIDNNVDTKPYTEDIWGTLRAEIGQYGKFTFAEYSGIFPGILYGLANTRILGVNLPYFEADKYGLGGYAHHIGLHITPGDDDYAGEFSEGSGLDSYNGFDIVDFDYTVEDISPDTLVGNASTNNSSLQSSFSFDLGYSYTGFESFGNPKSVQNASVNISYLKNAPISAIYTGGINILKRYGYKRTTAEAYLHKSTSVATTLGPVPVNTLTVAQVMSTLNVTFKINLLSSNFTEFNKDGSYGYQIHHDFYHGFTLEETLKEFTIDLLANPDISSGVWTGGVFGFYLPLVEEDTIDLSAIWALNGKQWIGIRVDTSYEAVFNHPETFVTPGLTTTNFNIYVSAGCGYYARATLDEDYYCPLFSGAFGQPVNRVWAPDVIRGRYPTTGIDNDKYIRNSLWRH